MMELFTGLGAILEGFLALIEFISSGGNRERKNSMSEKPENQKPNVALIMLVIVGLPILVLVIYGAARPVNGVAQTNTLCDKEAKLVLSQLQKGKEPSISEKQDFWGTNLEYHYEAKPEVLISTVNSNGPDGIKGNRDDISATKTDVNKSKIVGKWIGNKSRELGKGFLEGLKEAGDSAFEKDTNSDKPKEPEPEEKEPGLLDTLKKKYEESTEPKTPEPEETETPETEEKKPSFLDSLKNKFYNKEEDE